MDIKAYSSSPLLPCPPVYPVASFPYSLWPPVLINNQIPPLYVVIYLHGGWGNNVMDSLLEGVVLCLLVCDFLNSHGSRDAESWLVLLDFNSLPHKALQLGLIPSHLEHEMALVCCNYSHGWWRYCACNTIVSSSCCAFCPPEHPLSAHERLWVSISKVWMRTSRVINLNL